LRHGKSYPRISLHGVRLDNHQMGWALQ
jgi:hypothetical protein